MSKEYQDIIHLPHYKSTKRAHMPVADRAAQFAPFSAVVGHESAVKEAARLTDQKRVLDETEKTAIDYILRELEEALPSTVEVEILYYIPDHLKSGGQYVTKVGQVCKLDKFNRVIIMLDGDHIRIDDVYSMNITHPQNDI